MARVFFNPAYSNQLHAELLLQRRTFDQIVQQTLQPGFGDALAANAALYPYARPGVLFGMTQAGLVPGSPVANRMAEMSLEERLAADPTFSVPSGARPPRRGRPTPPPQAGEGVAGWLGGFGKALVRGTFMGLSAPVQELGNLITSAGEAALDGDDDGLFGDFWRNFTQQAPRSELAMAIGETYARVQSGEFDLSDPDTYRDLIQGDPEFIGTGFFPGGEIRERREQQKQNLQLNGEFLTPGRVLAGVPLAALGVIDEGSEPHRWITGLADAAFQVFADPANLLAGAGAARKAGAIARAADDLPEVVRAAQAVDATGFANRLRDLTLHTPRRMVDEGAEAFLRGGNREVNLLVAGLTQERNAQRIRETFGRSIGHHMAVRLADATRPEQVVEELSNSLDDLHVAGLPHLSRRQARQIARGLDEPELPRPALRRTTDRYTFAGAVPDRKAILSVNALDEAADNLTDWYRASQSQLSAGATGNIDRAEEYADRVLRIRQGPDATSRLGEVVRDAMDDLAGRLVDDKPALKAALSLSPDYVASQRAYLWDSAMREIERPGMRYRTLDDAGNPVTRTLREGEALGAMVDGRVSVVPNAAMVSQLATAGLALPDWKDLRRATSVMAHLGPLADAGWFVADAARSLAQPLWMALVLLRPAVTGRILLDSQMRMAFDGTPSAFRHPVEFISYLIGRKGTGPITGDLWADQQSFLDNLEAVNGLRDIGGLRLSRKLSNDFVEHSRLSDPEAWLDSITARLAMLSQDPVMRHLAGNGPRETADWLHAGQGRRWLQMLNDQALDGQVSTRAGVDQLLSAYSAHLDAVTGGAGRLKADIAAGRVAGVTVTPSFKPETGEALSGGLRQMPSDRYFDEARDALAGSDLLDVLPDRVYGSRPLRGLTDSPASATAARLGGFRDWLFDVLMSTPENLLARSVAYRAKYFDTIEALLPRMTRSEADDVIARLRQHSSVGGRLDSSGRAQLSRMESVARGLKAGDVNPDRIAAMSRLAGQEAARESLDLLYDLSNRAVWEDAAGLAAPFVAVWRDTLKTYFHPTQGLITTNPTRARKAMQAVESARDGDPDGDGRGFLYLNDRGEEVFAYGDVPVAMALGAIGGGIGGGAGNLAGRTAGAITRRVVSEGARTVGRRALTAGGAVAGATAGVGLARHATDVGDGANVGLVGRAAGLNVLSSTILPGVGPIVQLPLSYLVEATPQVDWLWRNIFPFGRPRVEGGAVESLLPAWMRRFATAVRNDPESQRLFGNVVADMTSALYASGDYGDDDGFLTDAERARLLKDATSRARALFWVRGFAQSTLPTGPEVEFTADTPYGEVAFNALATEYRAIRDEHGFDAATGEFIARYGTHLIGVTIPKSRTVRARSLDPQGADWERQNPELVRDFENTVAFFAPGADTGEFDQQAYNRAIARGDLVDLSPADRTRIQNNILGSAFIRAQRNLMGAQADSLTGRIYLADTRAALRETFPGYGAIDNLPSTIDTDAAIGELARATQDRRLSDHPLTPALAEMLRMRDQAIAVGRAMGATQFQTSTREEFVELRDAYRAEATRIMREVPEFAEVWRLVFERELLDDVGTRELRGPTPWALWQGPAPLQEMTTR